jgi:hypothetical protein
MCARGVGRCGRAVLISSTATLQLICSRGTVELASVSSNTPRQRVRSKSRGPLELSCVCRVRVEAYE